MNPQRTTKSVDEQTTMLRHSVARGAATLAALIAALSTDFLTQKTTTSIGFMSALFATVDFAGYLLGNFVEDRKQNINSSEHTFKRLRKKILTALKTSFCFCVFVCIFHFSVVLLGAAITTSVPETFHYSVLMSVLTVLPGCLVWGYDANTWLRLMIGSGSQTDWERRLVLIGLGTVGGSWLGAFAIPLDWDRPWQVWPVSCVYGALFGHLVVNVYALLVDHLRPATSRKRKHV